MTSSSLDGLRDLRVQVVGLGPAGLGVAVAADRVGRFDELMDHGVAFLDSQPGPPNRRRQSLAYVINSNSPAADFLAPIARDGAFRDVWTSGPVRRVEAHGQAPVALELVADVLAELTTTLADRCARSALSRVELGRVVSEVRVDRAGCFVTHDAHGSPLFRSRFLVLALGAEESHVDTRRLAGRLRTIVLRSGDFLRGDLGPVLGRLDANPRAQLAILGGSHSGFSAAVVLLERLGPRLHPGQVAILHQSIALYTATGRRFQRTACDLAMRPLPGEHNRFRGLRGDARALYEAIASGSEARVRMLPADDDTAREVLANAEVVIQAYGYEPRRLSIRDADGTPYDLGWEQRRLLVDARGRVMDRAQHVMPNLLGIGAGSCPQWIEDELQVGVNLFLGPHGASIVDQVLPVYRGAKSMPVSKKFSKAIGDLPGAGDDVEWAHQLKRGRVPGPRMEHNRLVSDESGLSTKAVHAGTYVDPTTGAVGTPLFQTTTFLFGEHTYASFAQGVTRDVPIYTRYGNPNQWAVQEKIASLEMAESSLVFSSGMAAIATTLQALTNHGGHIVTSYDVYGGTYNLMREDMHQVGRDVTFVDQTDVPAIERAIQHNTQVLFFETLTNPLLKPVDLRALGQLAARERLLLIVDNTFLSPVFLRPLHHGAHVVIHSGSKYLNGHSDLICGCASGSRKYVDRIWAQMLKSGGSLDPMSCFLLERGLKTLAVRTRAQHACATALTAFLERHPKIRRVHHPAAQSYAYPWFRELCPDGYGGVLSFEVEGGDEAALRLLDALTIPAAATSLGGVESLVSLPFNTSHSSLTAAQRAAVGIMPGLVRFSVGIEDERDLLADLDLALAQI